jgi:hypothetical membrane protein
MEGVGAIFWMCCLQFFLAEQVVRSGWTLPYSFARNYVSDLGATGCSALVCSPRHALMNGSFVLQGLLIMGGALLTRQRWSKLGRVGMWLLLVCGVGVVVVGFEPEDVNGELHRLGAALHFLAGGLSMLAVGLSLRRAFGWISLATAVAVLTATLAVGLGGGAWAQELGVGTVERVAAYGIAGWMAALGAYFYWQINSPRGGESPLNGIV